MFGWFKKPKRSPLEVKNYSSSFSAYLVGGGDASLSAINMLLLYKQAMPFYNAVNIRATYFSQLPLSVFNRTTNQYDKDHGSLTLLKNPNSDVTGNEFMAQLSNYFDITGNAYILATGRIEREPLELMVIPSQNVTFDNQDRHLGLLNIPSSMYVSNMGAERIEFKAIEHNNRIRFVNGNDKELWHIRSFNPFSGRTFLGLSPAYPVVFEIEQYIASNVNNLANLKNGSRPSIAWVYTREDGLTDAQYERLIEEKQRYESEANAGKVPLLDGVDIKTISNTNAEMQFKELQQSAASRIYNQYRIPLAKILDSVMTLSNLETSTLQLYDDAIIPLSSIIYAELTKFILSRYDDTQDLEYKFNPNEIDALRARSITLIRAQSDVGVNTINELRTQLGYEALDTGGDQLWRPIGLSPIAQDVFTEDNIKITDKKHSANNIFTLKTSKNKSKQGYM